MVDKVNEDDVALAIRRGALGRCPKCGLGNLFLGFLTVRQNCPVCREGFAEYRAADGPGRQATAQLRRDAPSRRRGEVRVRADGGLHPRPGADGRAGPLATSTCVHRH